MHQVIVCVNQNLMVLDVNSANLDSTLTPTARVGTPPPSHTHTHTHTRVKELRGFYSQLCLPFSQCAPVILTPHWTSAAPHQVIAAVSPITAVHHVISVLPVTMVTPAAHVRVKGGGSRVAVVEPGEFLERVMCFVQPVSVLQRVHTTAAVTVSPVSVFVELVWSDAGVTRAGRDRMASPAVKVMMPIPSTRAERGGQRANNECRCCASCYLPPCRLGAARSAAARGKFACCISVVPCSTLRRTAAYVQPVV